MGSLPLAGQAPTATAAAAGSSVSSSAQGLRSWKEVYFSLTDRTCPPVMCAVEISLCGRLASTQGAITLEKGAAPPCTTDRRRQGKGWHRGHTVSAFSWVGRDTVKHSTVGELSRVSGEAPPYFYPTNLLVRRMPWKQPKQSVQPLAP